MTGTTDRAAVTCKRCQALMDAGAERPLRAYLPSGRKPLKRKPKVEEPKETMDAAGLRIVLDASPYPLRKGDYP